jgi:hypothetical protein
LKISIKFSIFYTQYDLFKEKKCSPQKPLKVKKNTFSKTQLLLVCRAEQMEESPLSAYFWPWKGDVTLPYLWSVP